MQISKIHFSGPTLTALYSAFPFLKSTLFDLAKILEESYLCHNALAKVQCGTFQVGQLAANNELFNGFVLEGFRE